MSKLFSISASFYTLAGDTLDLGSEKKMFDSQIVRIEHMAPTG